MSAAFDHGSDLRIWRGKRALRHVRDFLLAVIYKVFDGA
jgi:hypothetical protein